MPASPQDRLPFIKKKSLTRKSTLSISKIQISNSKSKFHKGQTENQTKKPSLCSKNFFSLQKRSLSQKRFCLKRIETQRTLKNLKLSELNTDDNSEAEKFFETFQEVTKIKPDHGSITERAVDLLKNMKQVDKIAKLYKKETIKSKNSDESGENKKILKNKYKCLVNQHVFVRKSKHNSSEGAKSSKEHEKSHAIFGEEFWQNVNESMILESCRYEEPSKELYDLIGNIRTDA